MGEVNEEARRPAGKLVTVVATFFGLGYAPFASGTVGTVGAIPLFLVLALLTWPLYAVVWVLLLLLSFYVSEKVRVSIGQNDPKIVVIDEVLGYLAAMFMLPVSAGYIIAAFFLFRFFDITKPFPASYFDKKVKNGVGVVMDDVVAGIFTCIILHFYRYMWG